MELLTSVLEQISVKELSKRLNICPGTINRWIDLNDIPVNYEFDLLKIAGIPIDYSTYSSKQKDQFFTPPETAKKCFDVFCQVVRSQGEDPADFIYIEPSAGDGGFSNILPLGTIAMDIEPRHPTISQADFLDYSPPADVAAKYVVFGNPPFGLRGHMALKFINHSAEFAEYVGFILPQLFEIDGKGVPRKRVKGLHLIHSEKIESVFYEPDKTEIKINTIFQIWSKTHTNPFYDIPEFSNENMRVYSMSDGGTVATTRNKEMIGKCDIYLPSTCFGKSNVRLYDRFEDLPGKKGYGVVFHKKEWIPIAKAIHWDSIAFLSTNSAYNLRSSQIYGAFS